MTTDPFTEAARAEAEQYTPADEEVRTDYVMAYADRDSSQLLAGLAFDRWLAKRDQIIRRQERYIEELEAGHVIPRAHLAAQEPTDGEVLAGALGELAYLQGYDLAQEEDRAAVRSWWDEMSERVQRSRLATARAALSAARAVGRDEEKR